MVVPMNERNFAFIFLYPYIFHLSTDSFVSGKRVHLEDRVFQFSIFIAAEGLGGTS